MLGAMSEIDIDAWIGRALIDADGRRLGVIEETYCNKQTGEPLWMVVKSGRIRAQRRFVPLAGASVAGDAIRTPRSKQEVDDSPAIDPAQQLGEDAVRELYRHYRITLAAGAPEPAQPEQVAPAERVLRYLS